MTATRMPTIFAMCVRPTGRTARDRPNSGPDVSPTRSVARIPQPQKDLCFKDKWRPGERKDRLFRFGALLAAGRTWRPDDRHLAGRRRLLCDFRVDAARRADHAALPVELVAQWLGRPAAGPG